MNIKHNVHRCISIVVACAAISAGAMDDQMDSWYTPSIQPTIGSIYSLQLHADFEPVQPEKLATVVALLQDRQLVEIDAAAEQLLTGKQMAIAGEQRRFLVRSLHFAAHGQYTVERDHASLRIHHRSLGFDAPIVRQGLVVLLDRRPQAVFVTCSMAR